MIAAGCLAQTAPAAAAGKDDSGVIAFAGNRNALDDPHSRATFDIYVASADGSGLTNLTRTPHAEESSPAYSPGGRRIAYARRSSSGSNIWSMRADGSHRRALTGDSAAISDEPVYSPDGRFIYFASDRAGDTDIWRMRANGKRPVDLTASIPGEQSHPAISPDGSLVAFAQTYTDAHAPSVQAVGADGSPTTLHIDGASDPTFAPNGRLAYVGGPSPACDGGSGVFSATSTGDDVRGLICLVPHEMYATVTEPSFSPDGGRLAYVYDNHGPSPTVYWSTVGDEPQRAPGSASDHLVGIDPNGSEALSPDWAPTP